MPGRGIDPELLLLIALREDLLGPLRGHLVGGEVRRKRLAVFAALEVRPVLADAHDDVAARDRHGVDLAGVDVAEMLLDEILEAVVAVRSEIEATQPLRARLVAPRDLVEVVLHAGRELVVDEAREVPLEQIDHREREKLRHEGLALLPDIAAVEDRPHDRRVGRRAADATLLERLDQAGLGEAGRRARRVTLGLERRRVEIVALGQLRQALLFRIVADVVAAFLVGEQETAECDHGARGRELDRATVGRWAAMRTETVCPRASAICEATVRFQIRS